MNRSFVLIVSLSLLFVACAGTDGPDQVDTSSRDPRCVSACTARDPRYANAGRVCNAASRVQCLDECETRIAMLTAVCQNCLVEEACFGPDGCDDGLVGLGCSNNTCTITTEFGSCSFTYGDAAGEQRCHEQVDPRREVSCKTEFRPTTECASVCM
jgi:hypothetical protein